MGIREHQQPEVMTIDQLRAKVGAAKPNAGVNNLPVPAPGTTGEATCPTCHGTGKVPAEPHAPEPDKAMPGALSGGTTSPGK